MTITNTSVCVVRPPEADLQALKQGLAILAQATREVFARVYQKGDDAAKVKREVCARHGLLSRHYSGCRADAMAAVKGWRERLKEEHNYLKARLVQLEARREKDNEKPSTKRRNAIATRKAQTRLARVEKELQGKPRHCFGGRKLLRQGKVEEWQARRNGNALFVGETGILSGNGVARWSPETEQLEVRLPGSLRTIVLKHVRFPEKVHEDLRACIEARVPVSWRPKLLSRGKVELCVTYEEPEPVVCTDTRNGALALDLNADHIAMTFVSGDGRLLDTYRWDLRPGNDNIQQAARLVSLMAARRGVPVVAEDLDFRKKRAWLRQYGKRFAGMLSSFRTRQVMSAVERQCRRRGVELIVVNPAWTTKLAKEHGYPGRYRIGVHHAAGLVIGRRGLGFVEHVPKAEKPPVRAGVKRRGTLGWQSMLTQVLPAAWGRGGRGNVKGRPGAREGPVSQAAQAA